MVMRKITTAVLTIALTAATVAHAQSTGGRGHGGGGRRGAGSGSPPPAPAADAPRPARQVPLNQIEIIGVVQAVDPTAQRVTIAYEAVDPLNWPAGAMPFAVGKNGLLDGVQIGQKVRFKLESQRIVDLKPF
ncbi:MAG: hypothetical protein JWP92_2134 [Caulobacter sp.]|nr:hypothetical protein [Caulobacter sp.]